MQNTPSRARALALLSTPALSSALAGLASAAPASAKIRMGAVASDTYGEPYFGSESGIFARAGLNVEVSTFPSGGALLQACAAGALDVGIGEVIQVTNAINRGIPFGYFAGAALYSTEAPTTALVVAADGPIKTAKDCNHGTIAVYSLHSLSEIACREWLAQNGADPTTVRFVELPGSAMVESALRGVIAGGMPGEPYLSEYKGTVRVLGKPYDAIAKHFQLSAFYAHREWLAGDRDLIRRLVRAIYETARWSNAHHDQTAPIAAKYALIEPEKVRQMTRAIFATSLDPRMLEPVVSIAAKYKAVEKPLSAADLIVAI